MKSTSVLEAGRLQMRRCVSLQERRTLLYRFDCWMTIVSSGLCVSPLKIFGTFCQELVHSSVVEVWSTQEKDANTIALSVSKLAGLILSRGKAFTNHVSTTSISERAQIYHDEPVPFSPVVQIGSKTFIATMTEPLAASSSTTGFFQTLPVLPPQYTSVEALSSQARPQYKSIIAISDDTVIDRVLDLYLPSNTTEVTKHAHHVARLSLRPSVLAHATDAETNHPVLRPLTTFGEENRNDALWTTAGWQKLKEIGYAEGVVAVAYDLSHTTFNRRIHAFVLNHLWSPTGTMTGCPMSMTDGAATLLSKHLNEHDGDQPGRKIVFQEAYRRLTSRDPKVAWTSGQWMTERTGGSDVSGTETYATQMSIEEVEKDRKAGRGSCAVGLPLGPWRIDGFKWFSSATDSEMAVLLARTAKGGLSAFLIPMRRRIGDHIPPANILNEEDPPRTELNGIRIQRLKNKLGTKSLPTAELELKGARGWLIGTEGQGIKDISAILNITRLSTGAGSVASWGRGLAICRAYSKVRKVRGGLLKDNPAHLRWMADETVKYWAAAYFSFLGVALQGSLEQNWDLMVANTKASRLIPKDKTQVAALLRLILPVMKAQVTVASVHGLRQSMECLGGVGYCENNEDGGLMNIAKTYRDNLVNPIWEGTVSVMAEDVVRVLLDKRLGNGDVMKNIFNPWARNILTSCSAVFKAEVQIVEQRLQALKDLVSGAQKEELLYRGRELLDHIEVIVSSAAMLHDATVNSNTIAQEIATRWVQSKALAPGAAVSRLNLSEAVKADRSIFLGDDIHRQNSKL
jgi:alkylation response protein AidB-like acyl-CoA dehydrogenase